MLHQNYIIMNEKINIVCCLWGSWPSDNPSLGPLYVDRLYRAVERNVTVPYEFICFTDRPPEIFRSGVHVRPIEVLAPVRETPKWYVFNPDNGLRGRVVVLDLDTIITGNIDHFVTRDEPFIIRQTFDYKRQRVNRGIGGDMYAFNAGWGEGLWKKFRDNTSEFIQQTGGDERVAFDWLLPKDLKIHFWQDFFPGQYVSYKRTVRLLNDKILHSKLENYRLISFHGIPRPHMLWNTAWIKQYWR